ncbi:MAG: LUD domain-containing protein [Prolixibacteraceae bacterium]
MKALFKQSLILVGASVIELNGNEEIKALLSEKFPEASDFSKQEIWDAYPPSCQKEKLEKLSTVILEGHLGVAENGAIWLDESNFPNRLVPFIAQHLVIKINSHKIVGDMLEAYRQLNIDNTGFGVFLSGPSKTADIEQSLVYGAHGARSLLVIICNCSDLIG